MGSAVSAASPVSSRADASFDARLNAQSKHALDLKSLPQPGENVSLILREDAQADLLQRLLTFIQNEVSGTKTELQDIQTLEEARKTINDYRKLIREAACGIQICNDMSSKGPETLAITIEHDDDREVSARGKVVKEPLSGTSKRSHSKVEGEKDILGHSSETNDDMRRHSLLKREAFSPNHHHNASLTKITTSSSTSSSEDDGSTIKVNDYQLGPLLGAGSFGVVVKAQHKSGAWYAIKIIDRKRMRRRLLAMPGESDDSVKREIAIQKRLRHPNILPLIEVIDDPDHPKTYLVTSLVDGGPLMQDASVCPAISETRARHLFVQLVAAVDFLHKNNIIHKDIKPSNLLVDKSDHLYLSDFGAAQMFKDDELPMINRTDGTMAFIAPEMCSGEEFNGKLADIWAIGATLYMMIFGRPPFIEESAQALVEAIQEGQVSYPRREVIEGDNNVQTQNMTVENLLQRILEKDVSKRATIQEIAIHPWCSNGGRDDFLMLPEVNCPIEVSDVEIKKAFTPVQVRSFETIGVTILVAKKTLLHLRKRQSSVISSPAKP